MNLASYTQKGKVIIGIDEAGRGPWAGPVVASSLLFKSPDVSRDYYLQIRDSKKLSEKKREELYYAIIDDPNIEYNYSFVANDIIDEINILQATKQAMLNSLNKHKEKHDLVLIDGNQLINYTKAPMEAVIGGDDKVLSIAGASIIAKYMRDEYMREIDQEYPQYGFAKHKGYGTKLHQEALKQYGPCEYHRMSFKPVKAVMGI